MTEAEFIVYSATNKSSILNALIAMATLSAAFISTYFIKKGNIGLNDYNYIRRKVFRDQNRYNKQLQKNKIAEEKLSLSIKTLRELYDTTKELEPLKSRFSNRTTANPINQIKSFKDRPDDLYKLFKKDVYKSLKNNINYTNPDYKIKKEDYINVKKTLTKETTNSQILKINKKNNLFDFYDLQISEQTKIDQIYQHIKIKEKKEKKEEIK